uniref:VPS9 domain-containing protein n=1 Tax=Plectus sambesii TaxID=2011161 RepID=A0A914WBN3_9BILA
MTEYDENLQLNVFFATLKSKHTSLWRSAVEKKLSILVPQRSAVPKPLMEEIFMRHLLDAETDQPGVFCNMRGEEVLCCERYLTLSRQGDGCEYASVKILFEETFVTDDDQSYRVLCISAPLTTLKSSQTSMHTPSEVTSSIHQSMSIYADADFVLATLFSHEKDFRFESNLQNSCYQFNKRLLAHGGHTPWAVDTLKSMVYKQYDDTYRLVVRRRKRVRRSRMDEGELNAIRMATELFFFNLVGPTLLPLLRGAMWESESALNRSRLMALRLEPHELGLRSGLYESIPIARRELSALNEAKTPHGRLICLRKTILALSPSDAVNRSRSNSTGSDQAMSSDDILPALVYLVIRSSFVNDWCTNIFYMSDFYYSRSAGDELRYCLASFEAACEHVRSGNLTASNSFLRWPSTSDDAQVSAADSIIRQFSYDSVDEEVVSLRKYVLELVEQGDDITLAELFEQRRALINDSKNDSAISSPSKCHPLCRCKRCCGELPEETVTTSTFDVNCVIAPRSRTALHVAAMLGETKVVNALLRCDACVDVVDQFGLTPLHMACHGGSQSCTLLILHTGANPIALDERGETALHIAAKFNHVDCAKALLFFDQHVKSSSVKVNMTDDQGDTPLHFAVRYQHVDMVRVLLESNADCRIRNTFGRAPVDLCNNATIRSLLFSEDPSLEYFVVDTNQTPVNSSVPRGSLSVASDDDFQSVKSHHSDSSQDVCPSLNADVVRRCNDQESVTRVDKLIDAVAAGHLRMEGPPPLDINEVGSQGRNALHTAADCGKLELVEYLIDFGASVDAVVLGTKETALHICARRGHMQLIRNLVNHAHASMSAVDIEGDTPLHLASAAGHYGAVNALCELGANVHATNYLGETPLHCAVKGAADAETVEALLRVGASPFALNEVHMTPVDLAKTSSIRDLLESAHG